MPFWLRTLLLLTLAVPCFASRRDTGFLNRTVKVAGVEYRYQVYVPADWTKDKKWPVILFQHGSGERGSDGLLQTQVGIGRALREHADRWPFIVVMPQCRKDRLWVEPEMMQMALATLDASIKEFRGDKSRVYFAGLSMGGYGGWQMAARPQSGGTGNASEHRDDRFAAYVIICGGIEPPPALPELRGATGEHADPYLAAARAMGQTPVWLFHGDKDPAVPVEESRKMVEALKSIGASPRYTEFPGTGHNSWDTAFAKPELPEWLLAQRLQTISPPRH